jgi:hypothetical protein
MDYQGRSSVAPLLLRYVILVLPDKLKLEVVYVVPDFREMLLVQLPVSAYTTKT